MATLADLCDLMIEPSPCNEDEERRNWMMLARLRDILCELLGGSDGDKILNLTRFRLTANLAPGGSAAAVKLTYPSGTATTDDAITVNDVDPSAPWRGLVGYEGWAAQREADSTQYNILILERIARKIRGTLAADLSGGSASAAVSAYDDGKDPGTPVTVYDPDSRWPQALSGATYEAVYNIGLARYELTTVQVTEWAATAAASQNFGPTDTTVAIQSVTFKTFPDQDDDPPTPTTAENFLGLTGLQGDPLHLQRRWPDGLWEIINCPPLGSGSGTPVIYFKTTLPLHIGGSTSAVRLERQGGTFAQTDSVQVFDSYAYAGGRGMWCGPTGLKGMGRQREDNQSHYDIIWMEQHARFIFFQLTEDMGATTSQEATATVVYSFGQGVSPGATVTVHDDNNKFKYAIAGSWGFAVRDEYKNTTTPATPYYSVVITDQLALFGGAQLIGDSCGGGATVTQFAGWSTYPHGQTPPLGTVTNADNPFTLGGRDGDPMLLVFRDNSGGSGGKDYDYVWAQAKHKKVTVQVDSRFRRGCWEKRLHKNIMVMECGDPDDFESYVCGLDCP
jgi:hypothetical protein